MGGKKLERFADSFGAYAIVLLFMLVHAHLAELFMERTTVFHLLAIWIVVVSQFDIFGIDFHDARARTSAA